MAQWECPNCNGGFPEPVTNSVTDSDDPNFDGQIVKECPWCAQTIGAYNADLNQVITR